MKTKYLVVLLLAEALGSGVAFDLSCRATGISLGLLAAMTLCMLPFLASDFAGGA